MNAITFPIPTLFDNDDFTCEVASMLQFIAVNYDLQTANKALATLQEIEKQVTASGFEIDSLGIEGNTKVWITIAKNGDGWSYDTLNIDFDSFDGCKMNKHKVAFDAVATWVKEWIEEWELALYEAERESESVTDFYKYFGISPYSFI